MLEDTLVHLVGQSAGDQFGWSIVGDLLHNDDVSADMAVGAPHSDIGGANSGSVYIFHGPFPETRNASSADLIIVGDDIGSSAGQDFDVADVNGDGVLDYIVGAPVHSANNHGGGVYVLHGPLENFGFLSLAEGFWEADLSNARLGAQVAASHDLSGDGLIDIVASAPERDNGTGAVYVFDGSGEGIHNVSTSWASFHGDRINARLGESVLLYDLNADSQQDLIFSAPDSDVMFDQGGVVYFVEGAIPEGTSIPQAQHYGPDDFSYMGSAMVGGDNGVYLSAPGVDMDAGDVYLLNWSP